MEVSIERSDCISCGLGVSTCPDVFRIAEDGLAEVYRQPGPAHLPAVKSAAEGCPVSIIYLEEGRVKHDKGPLPMAAAPCGSFGCHASHPPPRRTAHRSAKNTLRLRRNFHKEVDTR